MRGVKCFFQVFYIRCVAKKLQERRVAIYILYEVISVSESEKKH